MVATGGRSAWPLGTSCERQPETTEAGQRVDANLLVDDLLAGPHGELLPCAFAFLIGLPDQRAAGLDAVERVGVGEGLGIAAENGGDVAQIAVDADALRSGDHEVAGR